MFKSGRNRGAHWCVAELYALQTEKHGCRRTDNNQKINGCLYYSAKPELPFGMNPNSMLFNTLLAKVKPLRGAVA